MPAPDVSHVNDLGFAMCKLSASTAVIQGRHVLLVNQGSDSDPEWNLPGGKVDPGETILDAAVRETLEETGLAVKCRGLSGIYNYVNRSGLSCLRFVFTASIIGGELACDGKEISAARWFGLDQLRAVKPARLWNPAILRAIIADLRRPTRLRGYPVQVLQDLRARSAA